MPKAKDTVNNAPAQFVPPPSGLEWFEDPADMQGGGADAAQKAEDDRVAALERQLAEMRGELNATRQQTTFQQQHTAPAAPEVKEISYEDLPDPLVDPKGYAKEVATRTKAYYDQTRKRDEFLANQQAQETNKYTSLWNQFAEQHADYAENSDLSEYATRKVINSYAQQGLDANRAMFGDTKKFFADVTAEMDRITGKPLKVEADDDDDRTEGMFGGQESGGRPGSTGQRPKRPESMFDGMADWQMKNGFY